MRRVFLGAALAAAATSAQASGSSDARTVVIANGQFTCPGSHADYRPYDWRDGYGRRPWRCDFPTRPHRDVLEDGFFGHGRVVRGGYDYDRGYPYDYYPVERARGRDKPGYTSVHREAAREARCEIELVRDGRGRKTVPVRVCRN